MPKPVVLPDDGPWQLVVHKGRVFVLSQQSGLYLLQSASLRRIEFVEGPVVVNALPGGRGHG